MTPKPNPSDFTFNGVLQQPHYDYAVRAWEKMEGMEEPHEINNMEQGIADITKETLLLDGWVETKDPVCIMQKKIENANPINSSPEDTDIKLVLHRYFNYPAFAVMFPDGGMLNFVANSMKDLKFFEDSITFYDCPY